MNSQDPYNKLVKSSIFEIIKQVRSNNVWSGSLQIAAYGIFSYRLTFLFMLKHNFDQHHLEEI